MESSKVRLVEYTNDLEKEFINLVTDPEVMKFVDGTLSVETAKKIFADFTNESAWAVKLQATDKYIGHSALLITQDRISREILFYVKKDFWGQGLATEIGTELIHHAKSISEIKSLIATIDSDHLASSRVCEKIGLQFFEKGNDEMGEFLIYKLDLL